MENSCTESVPALFSNLMNEISHTAQLQALAHLGRALPLSLFVSFFNAFTHLIAIRQLLTHILATNTIN